MATLEKIRSKAALLVVVVGGALFAFIIGDFLRSGSTFFRQNKEKVAIVDGQAINIQEYQQKVEQLSNLYRNRGSISEDMQHQIRESIFNQMVNTILLEKETNKLGIAVGKDERADIIMGNNISPTIKQMPDFQNPQTGAFDKNQLIQFLQMIETDDISMYPPEAQQQILNSKEFWANIESTVVEEKLANKLLVLLSSAITANSLDAKASFQESSVSVDFDYALQSFSSIPDTQVSVSDAEISQLYNQRKESFKQEKSKIVNYIAVNIVPSQKDFQDVEDVLSKVKPELLETDQITEIVNENSDIPYKDVYISLNQLSPDIRSFVENAQIGSVEGPILNNNVYHLYKFVDTKQAPDSIHVFALTLPSVDEAKTTQLSDSLIAVLKGGKTFAEMASEATGGQINGEMGWQTELSLSSSGADNTFIQGVFDAKLNDPFVLKTALNTHLVLVTEKTNPVMKYKVAEISATITPSSETYNKLYNDLNHYISTNNNPTAFKDTAEGASYVCTTDVHVFPNQNSIAPIQNSRQVIRWAFGAKTNKISDIFECDDYFVTAIVTGSTKEGYRPLADVSDLLKRELLNKKKGEKIVTDLKGKNLSTMEAYAQAMNTDVQNTKFVTFNTPRITGIGAEPAVNAEAVSSQVGQLTGPFAGNNAVYVLSLTNKSDGGEYNEAAVKNQMQMQNSYRYSQAVNSGTLLQENAKIEDNRLRFY